VRISGVGWTSGLGVPVGVGEGQGGGRVPARK